MTTAPQETSETINSNSPKKRGTIKKKLLFFFALLAGLAVMAFMSISIFAAISVIACLVGALLARSQKFRLLGLLVVASAIFATLLLAPLIFGPFLATLGVSLALLSPLIFPFIALGFALIVLPFIFFKLRKSEKAIGNKLWVFALAVGIALCATFIVSGPALLGLLGLPVTIGFVAAGAAALLFAPLMILGIGYGMFRLGKLVKKLWGKLALFFKKHWGKIFGVTLLLLTGAGCVLIFLAAGPALPIGLTILASIAVFAIPFVLALLGFGLYKIYKTFGKIKAAIQKFFQHYNKRLIAGLAGIAGLSLFIPLGFPAFAAAFGVVAAVGMGLGIFITPLLILGIVSLIIKFWTNIKNFFQNHKKKLLAILIGALLLTGFLLAGALFGFALGAATIAFVAAGLFFTPLLILGVVSLIINAWPRIKDFCKRHQMKLALASLGIGLLFALVVPLPIGLLVGLAMLVLPLITSLFTILRSKDKKLGPRTKIALALMVLGIVTIVAVVAVPLLAGGIAAAFALSGPAAALFAPVLAVAIIVLGTVLAAGLLFLAGVFIFSVFKYFSRANKSINKVQSLGDTLMETLREIAYASKKSGLIILLIPLFPFLFFMKPPKSSIVSTENLEMEMTTINKNKPNKLKESIKQNDDTDDLAAAKSDQEAKSKHWGWTTRLIRKIFHNSKNQTITSKLLKGIMFGIPILIVFIFEIIVNAIKFVPYLFVDEISFGKAEKEKNSVSIELQPINSTNIEYAKFDNKKDEDNLRTEQNSENTDDTKKEDEKLIEISKKTIQDDDDDNSVISDMEADNITPGYINDQDIKNKNEINARSNISHQTKTKDDMDIPLEKNPLGTKSRSQSVGDISSPQSGKLANNPIQNSSKYIPKPPNNENIEKKDDNVDNSNINTPKKTLTPKSTKDNLYVYMLSKENTSKSKNRPRSHSFSSQLYPTPITPPNWMQQSIRPNKRNRRELMNETVNLRRASI